MLIQLVLDPSVKVIEPSTIAPDESDFCVTVRTLTAVLQLVAVHDVEDGISVPSTSGSIRVPRSSVLRQPKAGTARMIWAARGRPIAAWDRLQILMAIEAHADGITIGALLAASERSPAEQTEAVFVMACEGLVTIDLIQPFSLSTRVRSAALVSETSGSDISFVL